MRLQPVIPGLFIHKWAYKFVAIGEKIGENLLRYMVDHDLTEGEVAARAGISQPAISSLVLGKTAEPKLSTLFALAAVLPGLTLEKLLAGVAQTSQQRDKRSRGAHLKRLLEDRERGRGLE